MRSSEPDSLPLLARGGTADVYAWGDGQVLKLFRSARRDVVEYEARLTRVAGQAGLPVPAVAEVVERAGRVGIVFERADGATMLRHVIRRPWTARRFGQLLGQLHRDVHERAAPELMPAKERLRRSIEGVADLPSQTRARVLEVLQELPDGDRICHGDFHPDNVLLTARGPVIIDWIDASRGDPLADVARTLVLMRVGAIPARAPARWMINAVRGGFRYGYVRRYFGTGLGAGEALRGWIAVTAAARLREGIPGEAPALLRMVDAGLPGHVTR